MKGTAVVYIDGHGFEHDALIRAVNAAYPSVVDLYYVDVNAPVGDNLKTVFSVVHMDDDSKKETNPELPQIHLNCWKEPYRIHGQPAADHPIFDHPFEDKKKDELGKPVEKARPEWEAQIAAHRKRPTIDELLEILHSEEKVDVKINPDGSVTTVPSAADLDAVADEQKAAEATAINEAVKNGAVAATLHTDGSADVYWKGDDGSVKTAHHSELPPAPPSDVEPTA